MSGSNGNSVHSSRLVDARGRPIVGPAEQADLDRQGALEAEKQRVDLREREIRLSAAEREARGRFGGLPKAGKWGLGIAATALAGYVALTPAVNYVERFKDRSRSAATAADAEAKVLTSNGASSDLTIQADGSVGGRAVQTRQQPSLGIYQQAFDEAKGFVLYNWARDKKLSDAATACIGRAFDHAVAAGLKAQDLSGLTTSGDALGNFRNAFAEIGQKNLSSCPLTEDQRSKLQSGVFSANSNFFTQLTRQQR